MATVLAIGLLPILAACGGSDGKSDTGSTSANGASGANAANDSTTNADGAVQLNVPDDADDDTKKLYLSENTIAACMKKQGFTYTPHVASGGGQDAVAELDAEDYAAGKKAREKYGFGTYAAAVYPDDPQAPFGNGGGRLGGKVVGPVDNDEKGFTDAQKNAYEAALMGSPSKSKGREELGGCELAGSVAANGPAKSAEEEKKAWDAKVEENRANGLALNGDTQLVQLAQEFATCLKGQGLPVSTTQPTGMADMVRRDQQVPENARSMTKEEALPLLTKEIDISLKDLECGKKFRAAYFPKEKAHPYWGENA
ncbi:hypothetical protein STRTUCAR8_04948 [Streptomyces turgidiscabies Car8]|uniref:Uncharacterized protein n=1 Tax=Streptomyces turgidiscabies (strain Car8) TaxID=698760 RepID=L7F9J4_STRT8|nr:hypothetical protein STRTUCAR8_04948 [Streptomyces turgidiscabies Car8]